MSSTHRSNVPRVLLVAAGVLALQACGDDETGASSGETTTASSSQSSSSVTSTSAATSSATGATTSGSSGGEGGTSQGGAGQGGAGGDGQGGTTSASGGGGTGGTGGTGQGGAGGGGGTGQGGGGGTLDCSNIPSTDLPGDHCDAVAAAFCANLETCHTFFFSLLVGTEAECLLYFEQNCEHEQLLPGQTATAADLEACAEVVVNAPCGCSTTEVCGGGDGLGTLADGAACEVDTQCMSGFCDTHGDACGLCLATVPSDGSCAGEHEHCADDHYCDPADDTCQPEKAPGSACLENYECMTGTTESNDKCADGVCGTGLGQGEPCVGDDDDACEGTLFCHPASSTCEPLAINGPGEPCGYDLATMTIALCRGDLTCSAQLGGTCLLRKVLDEPCTLSQGGEPSNQFDHDCLPHLSCTAGTCQVTADVTCR